MKGTSVRRMIAALAATTVGLGLPVVLASSASADITAPAQNAVLRGTVTLSASGATDSGTACVGASSPYTQLQLRVPGGAAAEPQQLAAAKRIQRHARDRIVAIENAKPTYFCSL